MFAEQVLKAFSNYPIVECAVALLILYGGYRLMNKGSKDGPPPHEFPLWLTSGPVDNVFGAIYGIQNNLDRIWDQQKEDRRRQERHNEKLLELLNDLKQNSRRQVQALEMIQNENVINPRRLTE